MEKSHHTFTAEFARIKPKKYLGQHFLISQNILSEMVKAIEPNLHDTIIEVGAGTGILTFALAPHVKHLIAVEKDQTLSTFLNKEIKKRNLTNVEIMTHDVLHLPHSFWKRLKNFKIVGNIPYYLTGRLLRNIFEETVLPRLIALLLQEEVARRITADPPSSNLLGISTQAYGKPLLLGKVGRENFWPEPGVDSRILTIRDISRNAFLRWGVAEKALFKVLRAAFSQKRKLVVNSLTSGLKMKKEEVEEILQEAGIARTSRAQELKVEDFFRLAKLMKNYKRKRR